MAALAPAAMLVADETPTFATFFLTIHAAFRRDVAGFRAALERPVDADAAAALGTLWESFDGALHGHHELEDTKLFPSLLEQEPALAEVMAALAQEHDTLGPLLERIGAAVVALPDPDAQEEARGGIAELDDLLERHLGREEREVVPVMRRPDVLATFPPPELPPDAAIVAWLLADASPAQADAVVRAYRLEVPGLHEHRRTRADLEGRAGLRAYRAPA